MSFATVPETPIGPTLAEDVFPSPDSIFDHLQKLGNTYGYAVKRSDSYPNPKALQLRNEKHPNWVLFTCTKARKPAIQNDDELSESTSHDSKRRKKLGSKKVQCPFKVKAVRISDDGSSWRLKVKCGNHNHDPHIAPTADPMHRVRAQSPSVLEDIERMNRGGASTSTILATLRNKNPDLTLIPRDLYNLNQAYRARDLGGKPPIQWLLDVSGI